MADTVRVTKLGRGRRGGRRGRNTLRSIGARDVDKERYARIVSKKAEKARAKNDPNKKVRKTSAQRFRAGQDEKAKQIRKVTNEKTRLQQTLAGAGAAAGMLGGPLAKVVGAGGRVLGKAVTGKVASVAAKKAAEKAAAAAAKKAAAAAAKKATTAAAKRKAKADAKKKAADQKAAAAARRKAKADAKKKPVEMSAAARKKAEKVTRGYKQRKPKNRFSSPANAKIVKDAGKGKPKPKVGKGKGKGKGKDNKAAVTTAASKSKNIGKKLGIGAGVATAIGTGAYMGGRKPSDATPRPPKPDNKIDWTVDDEDRIVKKGKTITSNPKGDGSRTGLDLETLLSRIEDREYAQDPEDVQHDLADLKADLKELRGYRRGGPVRRSRTTNQFRGWGKARKPKHRMR